MKRSQKLNLVILFITVCLIITGCGSNITSNTDGSQPTSATTPAGTTLQPTEIKEKSFNWCQIDADMLHMDPFYLTDGMYYDCIYEGLVREEPVGTINPAAAESWTESDDGKTLTFKIRDNATWTNGDPVTAHDFVYAWKRVIDPANGAPYGWIFEYANIVGCTDAMYNGGSMDNVGIKALDDKTLEVKLTAPTPWFYTISTFFTFMPVNQRAVESGGEGWSNKPETACGNGPFRIASYTPNELMVLEKRDDYWEKDKIYMDKINIIYIPDQNTAYTAYKQGEIDVREGVPETAFAELKTTPNSGFLPLVHPGVVFVDFNLNVEPLNDIMVRLAMSYAVDREVIAETFNMPGVAKHVIPTTLLDNKGNKFAEEALKLQKYVMPTDDSKFDEARKLLAEAGYPNGEGFPTLKLLTNSNFTAIPQLLQEMWKQNLGINIEIDGQERSLFLDNRKARKFDLAWASWIVDYADPSSTLGIFTKDNQNNYPGFFNEEYDELVKFALSSGGDERWTAMYKASALFMDEVPAIPLYEMGNNFLIRPGLEGWVRKLAGMDMSRVYWAD